MSVFKIEKNIPMPGNSGRGPTVDYPFLQMEVGDSIFVPGIDAKKASGQIGYWKKNHGLNFSVRAMTGTVLDPETGEETEVDGVRIWVRPVEEKSNRGRKPADAKPAVETEAAEGTTAEEAEEAEEAAPAPAKPGKRGRKADAAESDY